jgi:NADPH:quinone reductase-like Zn-dependent oxidoreductase
MGDDTPGARSTSGLPEDPSRRTPPAGDVIRRLTSLAADRFDAAGRGPAMKAVVTTGCGGLDRLDYREVPRPRPAAGEVLLQVLAAGVNTTDVNTRLGWYSPSVTAGTDAVAAAERGAVSSENGGWSGTTPFPLIQGTDCCGRIAEIGPGADERVLGRRALVRPCMRPSGFGSMETVWMGSDLDGAFAQYVTAPASEVFVVDCDWSDAELGSIPCAYGTAENMLRRARVAADEHVLVTGASGGVGSAVVQLAKRRGAFVTAVTRGAKAERVRDLGADHVVDREDQLAASLGARAVDVVVDNVSGPGFDGLLDLLKTGGRYVSSGAVAGPLVTFDKRTLYLNDLAVLGCTAWDEPVFSDLVALIERGEIRPLVAKTFPLEQIADAQREFLEKRHVGNFVLLPPQES